MAPPLSNLNQSALAGNTAYPWYTQRFVNTSAYSWNPQSYNLTTSPEVNAAILGGVGMEYTDIYPLTGALAGMDYTRPTFTQDANRRFASPAAGTALGTFSNIAGFDNTIDPFPQAASATVVPGLSAPAIGPGIAPAEPGVVVLGNGQFGITPAAYQQWLSQGPQPYGTWGYTAMPNYSPLGVSPADNDNLLSNNIGGPTHNIPSPGTAGYDPAFLSQELQSAHMLANAGQHQFAMAQQAAVPSPVAQPATLASPGLSAPNANADNAAYVQALLSGGNPTQLALEKANQVASSVTQDHQFILQKAMEWEQQKNAGGVSNPASNGTASPSGTSASPSMAATPPPSPAGMAAGQSPQLGMMQQQMLLILQLLALLVQEVARMNGGQVSPQMSQMLQTMQQMGQMMSIGVPNAGGFPTPAVDALQFPANPTQTVKPSTDGSGNFSAGQYQGSLADPMAGSKYEITSGFGPRWGRMHNGIDLAGAEGSPITAPAAGKVEYVGYDEGGYGHWAIVRMPNGYSYRIAHLQERAPLKEGQLVGQGAVIGKLGNTGGSTGPHLHFEVRDPSDKAIDPLKFFPQWTVGFQNKS